MTASVSSDRFITVIIIIRCAFFSQKMVPKVVPENKRNTKQTQIAVEWHSSLKSQASNAIQL